MNVAELELLDWVALSRRLTGYAKSELGARGSWQEAEEIMQETLRELVKAAAAGAGPVALPSVVLSWAQTCIDNRLSNRSRTRSITQISALADEDGADQFAAASPTPERSVIDGELASKALDLLLDRASNEELVGEILMLEVDGVVTAREQASALEVPVERVYVARKRLKDLRRDVLDELNPEAFHG